MVAFALSIEAPGVTAGPLSCGWSIDGSLAEPDVSLLSVASISSTSVWAVGWRALGDIDRTVTVHWNGAGWNVVPSPSPNGHYDVLLGVAGTSDTDVWAVGATGLSFPYGSLIEHWNGSVWTVVPAPDGVVGALNAVSADSPTDAWVVGDMDGIVAHWDGSTWSLVPTPVPDVILHGVAALSPTDVWAVGEDTAPNRRMVAMHWDGTTWTVLHLSAWELGDVSARASNDVWMTGNDGVNTAEARHWNGRRLPQYPLPDPGTEPWVDAVTAVGRGDVWIVGYQRLADFSYSPLAYHLQGRVWSVVSTPDVSGSDDFLYDVAADPATHRAWAVGTSNSQLGQFNTLVLNYFPC